MWLPSNGPWVGVINRIWSKMAKIISEEVGAFYHHQPRVAAVVTVQVAGRENAMTVDWHTPLSLRPPLYGISLAPERFTYQQIVESKEFGINFLPFDAVELVALVGMTGGRYIDKFQQFNIAKDKALKTKVPILAAAYAAYECQLVDDRSHGDHRLLVGEIVAVYLQRDAFTQDQLLDLDRVSPILYLGREFYLTSAQDSLREIY